MGLDIYVGSLSRYYLGAWETIVQQAARQQGFNVRVIRPAAPKPSIFRRLVSLILPRRNPLPALQQAILQWQHSLEQASGAELPFVWNDSVDYDYYTDKPGWQWYGALLLWAAHEQDPNESWPTVIHSWSKDPAFQKVRSRSNHEYPHLLSDTEIWLPVEVPKPFDTTDPFGNDTVVGSSLALLRELRLLNTRTWNASANEIAKWRAAELPAGHESDARIGFALVYELCTLAVQHRLPMKLDY